MSHYRARLMTLSLIAGVCACSSNAATQNPNPTGPSSGTPARFYGPVGAAVEVEMNDGTTWQGTMPVQDDGYLYNVGAFTLESKLEAGKPYTVNIKSNGPNLTCAVFAGKAGTMPVANGALRVGCESTFDHVSRSTDNTKFAMPHASAGPLLGGANVAIGAGATEAYGEGRAAAFVSSDEVAGTSSHRQIYWRDRITGQTIMISKAADGTQGNGDSWNPVISTDGTAVAFQSYATNLVSNDTNGQPDIFVWTVDAASETAAGTVIRANVGPGGIEANAASDYPTISGNGKVVAFETNATNLTSLTLDDVVYTKVIRRDLQTGTNTAVAGLFSGHPAGAYRPALAEDGNRVAFWAYDDVPGDISASLWDIFVYDHQDGGFVPVSLRSSGGARNQGDDSISGIVQPAISGDGKWVTYGTASTNVVAGDTNGEWDIFVVEVDNCSSTTCNVKRVNVASDGSQAETGANSTSAPLSYDGKWIAFTSNSGNLGVALTTTGITNAFLHDRTTGKTVPATEFPSGGGVGTSVSITRSGLYVGVTAGTGLDPRFDSRGAFARFTNVGNAFSWLTD